MNKTVMSSTWVPSGPALWDQPARPTTLALPPLCANLCLNQFAHQAPAAARVGCPVDGGSLHRSPTGRPERGQPPDAPPADRVVGVDRPPPCLPACSASRYPLFDGTILSHHNGIFAVMDAARLAGGSRRLPPWRQTPPPLRPVCTTLAHPG